MGALARIVSQVVALTINHLKTIAVISPCRLLDSAYSLKKFTMVNIPKWLLLMSLTVTGWPIGQIQMAHGQAADGDTVTTQATSNTHGVGSDKNEANLTSTERPLDHWLQQLSSDQYRVRQAASQKILQFGDEAVQPLVTLTKSGQLEASERAISILQALAARQAPDDEDGAYGALNTIADNSPSSSAIRARSALKSLGIDRTRFAYESLLVAGVKLGYQEFVIENRSINENAVRIDSKWNGDVSVLRWLKWVKLTGYAILEGPAVNREVLERLVQMPDLHTITMRNSKLEANVLEPLAKLSRIDLLEFRYVKLSREDAEQIAKLPIRVQLSLMGTDLDDGANQMLREKLAGLKIDIKQGGFLGVQCNSFAPFCQIDRIVTGGAAEDAGMMPGDVVEKIDEAPIANFTDLQTEISKHRADDELTLHVDRQGDKLVIKVKLKRLAND